MKNQSMRIIKDNLKSQMSILFKQRIISNIYKQQHASFEVNI